MSRVKLYTKIDTVYGGKYLLGTKLLSLNWGSTEFERYFGVGYRQERFFGIVASHV